MTTKTRLETSLRKLGLTGDVWRVANKKIDCDPGSLPQFRWLKRVDNHSHTAEEALRTKTPGRGETMYDQAPLLALEMSKYLWMQGATIAGVQQETGLPRKVYHKWLPTWRLAKLRTEGKFMQEYAKVEKERIERILDKTLEAIEGAVEAFKKDKSYKPPKEIVQMVNVLQGIHQISQLEQGRPTEISARVRHTHKEILEQLREADPFVDYMEDRPVTETNKH